MAKPGDRKRVTTAGVVSAALGLALFAYTLKGVGVSAVVESIAGIGAAGFGVILALSGFRIVTRALAWTQCVEEGQHLAFRDALPATLIGEAVCNLTPLANALGEPTKAVLVRERVPLVTALSAIVVENIVYGASVAIVVALGAGAFLLAFHPAPTLWWASVGALALMAIVFACAIAVLRIGARPVSHAMAWLAGRGLARAALLRHYPRVQAFEEGVNAFYARHRRRILPLLLIECSYHVAGIAEIYVTLRLMSGHLAPTFLGALVLESAGRVINVVFNFIPMRVGVDEAGNGLLTRALELGTVSGVALALIRKARMLVWTGVGIAVLLHRGLTPRAALAQAQAVAGDHT